MQAEPHCIRRTSSVKPTPDFAVENHGTIFLLRPLTTAARVWVDENIGQDNGFQPYFPAALVIEHRFIQSIVEGARRDGLVCR
jgi:hypothetical protein